ncbi:MAG: long-chain fatty acid--CoA ligase [Syntrophaceae bacterium]|nr:long-chain fatty acid--CoA ligase [Syntrophaceae bacterium]
MKGVNLASYLEHSVHAHPGKAALIFEEERWTFREFDAEANRIANGLVDLGVEKGDRVSLFLPNCPEFLFWYFGALKMGAVVNPINTMLKERELEYVIRDCAPKVLVTAEELAAVPRHVYGLPGIGIKKMIVVKGKDEDGILANETWVKRYPPIFNMTSVEQDDLAAILYTSGTTGQPKGVMLTHLNLWTNARHCADWAETTYNDITVCALPLFHSYALSHVVGELFIEGGAVVWLKRFDPTSFLEAMASHRATACHCVATMYYALVNHPNVDEYARKIRLRYCVTGAAVTPEPILQAWNAKFTPLSEGYGLTEASPVVFMNPLPGKGVQKVMSCGVPIVPEIKVGVVNEDGKPVAVGEVGELIIQGPNVMKGYWNKPEATAKSLRDGWLYTGDMVSFDEDGYYYIRDRKNDMINRSAFNIYPKELEDVLYTHPAVAEVQVVGIPDLVKGEEVVACLALKPGNKTTEEDVILFCRKNLASYKVPKYIRFFETLPKTVTGKLEKMTLRKILLEEQGKQ